jgi:hypothetical protein
MAPPRREDVLRLIDPNLEPALRASEKGVPIQQVAVAEYFFSFFRLPIRPTNPRVRATFLLGTPPTWDDIAADLDAHREVNDVVSQALLEVMKRDSGDVLIISSAAGGGKSTICKRVAMELVDAGYSVYFSDGESSPHPEKIASYLAGLEEKAVLFFDHAGHDLSLIAELSERIRDLKVKPAIVIAARSNDLAFRGYEFERVGARTVKISVPNLSDPDIHAILDTLERHNLLGNLRELSTEERIETFRTKAKKQILVAMREATSGRGFDDIIRDEFDKVHPKEAQLLYLVAALASDEEYGITVQQMITAMELPPNDTQVLVEASLAGILVQQEFDASKYIVRHPAIAHFVIESAPRPMLADAVIALLITISTVLPDGRERRRSRAFRLYREILNHRRLSALFESKSFLVRKIYETIKDYYRDDGHYWLQYGSFETDTGVDLSLAENYIAQAAALLPPTSRQVDTATAHLLLKKALVARNASAASELVDESLKILRAHMADRSNVSLHALHIFGSQMQAFVWKWTPTVERAARFREVHDGLRRALPDHLSSHPELRLLIESLKRAELETTVHRA